MIPKRFNDYKAMHHRLLVYSYAPSFFVGIVGAIVYIRYLPFSTILPLETVLIFSGISGVSFVTSVVLYYGIWKKKDYLPALITTLVLVHWVLGLVQIAGFIGLSMLCISSTSWRVNIEFILGLFLAFVVLVFPAIAGNIYLTHRQRDNKLRLQDIFIGGFVWGPLIFINQLWLGAVTFIALASIFPNSYGTCGLAI